MDFSLTEEQEMMCKSARDFLAEMYPSPKKLVREMEKDEKGYSPEVWDRMAELGWMGMVVPEEYGGMGGSYFNLALLLEEMGRACLPGPFFSTIVLGGLTILEAGSEEQKKELLPEVAKGRMLLTLALYESDAQLSADSVKAEAVSSNNGWLLKGAKLFVPDAHIAKYIICPARTPQGISLFLLDAKSPGVGCILLKTLAGDKQCEVIFDNVKFPQHNLLGELGHGWDYIERILPKVTIAKCAEMVGGAQQVLEMAVSYAKGRVQFEHPIGSFQAIQHHCANMAIDVDSLRLITYQVAWMLSEGLPCAREVSIAKAWVGEAYHRVSMLAAEIHASIGLTMDHDFPLYYRRAKAAELVFGDGDFHREIVARMAGL